MPEESYLCKRVMTGNFYGYTQRKDPNGLVYLVPDNRFGEFKHYRLIPIDKDGKERHDLAVTTEQKRETSIVE
jgi:hypothetical protein